MAQPQPESHSTELLALVAAYQAQTQALRDRVERFVRALWASLGVYRDVEMTRYVREVVPVVLGAQTQMASLTAAYLGHQRQYALGTRFKPVSVNPARVIGTAARQGNITPDLEHQRAFHEVWTQLHDLPRELESIQKAIDAGERRAVGLALDDLQLTKNHTAVEVAAADDRVKYVERVLEGAHSCGLCIVASTQRYHPGRLMPIHGGCDCSQRFLYADEDPGRLLHLDRLQDVHYRIQQRFGTSDSGSRAIPGASNYETALNYRDVLITHEHGELGPVLGVRGQNFDGPGDVTPTVAA